MVSAASEDSSYNPVEQADLLTWATAFALTFPVLADDSAAVDALYDPMSRSRPTYVLLGPGAEIIEINSISDADIVAALPTAYP